MNQYSKEHFSKEEQISELEKMGISVDDSSILDKVNYSHLIYFFGNHYKIQLENREKVKYKNGTKLSNIYNLFRLNCKASAILFNFFFEFEHKLKAATAYRSSKPDPLWYLNKVNYENKKNKNFCEKMKDLEVKFRKDFDQKYYKEGQLPIWLIIDKMTLNYIFELLEFTPERDKIYSDLKISNNKLYLLTTIRKFRNRIFHGNPLKANIDEFLLIEMLGYIKEEYRDIFIELKNLLNNTDILNETGISKNEIIEILKIKGIFD